MDEKEQRLMEKLNDIYSRRDVQIALDIIRIGLVVLVLMLGYYMYRNIEEVKMLNSDPCEYCMFKTGADCFYPINIGSEKKELQKINVTKLNDDGWNFNG